MVARYCEAIRDLDEPLESRAPVAPGHKVYADPTKLSRRERQNNVYFGTSLQGCLET